MPEFTSFTTPTRYKVYVTWVDHGTYVQDARVTPALSNFSMETGRNFHVTGFRIDGVGDPFKYNILVPQEIQGSFKMPQIGDVIVVEEHYRNLGDSPVYVYSVYNDLDSVNFISSQIPPWGGLPGDYGHLRSHGEHNFQFSEQAKSDFTQKFIKSVTGYRFRNFYGHVYGTQNRFLDRGKFVVRGDVVFDVSKDDPLMSAVEINTESGMDIVPVEGNSLSSNQSDYPNPLNVPILRDFDSRYVYNSSVPRFLEKQVEGNLYSGEGSGDVNAVKDERYKYVLSNKNYFSYQPIVDRKYFEYIESISADPEGNKPTPYERELPAAEEYQVALRGNNKLLIQDQYGDGEQVLITLKNQYDAGFTIVHNAENGQVRVRDHLGQGVLLESNPEAPRVVTWTTERQVIDMGSIRIYDEENGDIETQGEYIYLRNGNVFGKADTTFGRMPENEILRDEVPQQEFLMVNSSSDAGFSKLLEGISSRLSKGITDIIMDAGGNGFFFRNNPDPKETNQFISVFNSFDAQPIFTTRMYQEHRSELNGKNVLTDFTQTVRDNESQVSQISSYEDSTATSSVEHVFTSNATTAKEEKVIMHDGASGMSIYTHENISDGLESKTTTVNSFVGQSEVQVVTKAQLGGTAEELKTLTDLTSTNEIEVYMNTDTPTTRLTQRLAGQTVNTSEFTNSSIVNTQYGPPGTPNNKVEQLSGNINIQRIEEAVDITLTGRNIKIQGKTVDIEEL